MNNGVSVAELTKDGMYRNNSLSNIIEGQIKTPEKNQYGNFESKTASRNLQTKTEQVELFEKFYQTVKPTDDKTYKKIINFT